MRAQQRLHGRFVSTCGLRKVACAPGSRYELIIVDRAGHPVSHLTEWYRQGKQPGTDSTRRTYLNFLLPFYGYLLQRDAAWNQKPEAIRTLVKEFLRSEVACQVASDQDLDGYRVQLTGNSPLSQSSLRVLFAALRDFYAVMIEAGLYAYDNPMRSELLSKWKRERMRQIANAGAPDHAGIRGEPLEKSWLQPTAFFRLKRKQPWKPGLALEPAFVLQRVKKVLLSMIERAPTQRDRLVLLLLHQTGARISEVLGLTAGGWRKARHATRALVTNKGSLGREEKIIYFTPAIERALVQYIRTERACHDPQQRKRLEQLADHEPIFLTRRGTPYTRTALYYHWDRWLATIPPDEYTDTLGPVLFSPHDIRHLYVSSILRQIKQRYANNPEKQVTLKWALQYRMAWRSPLTMSCYDQSESEREKLIQFDAFLQDLEQQVTEHDLQSVGPSAQECSSVLTTPTSMNLTPAAPSIELVLNHEARNEQPQVTSHDLRDLAFWEDGS
jgi:site-specific recombinase XerD